MRRREFIAVLGGAPLCRSRRARSRATPVIGFLDSRSSERYGIPFAAFRRGLKDVGFIEGENVAIEYRWGENRVDRLPEIAAELVRRQPAVIVTTGGPTAALAAKAATTTIPIVFLVGEDPTRLGLVEQPGPAERQSHGHQPSSQAK